MVRIQVYLTEYQTQRLRLFAEQRGVPITEVIRHAIDRELEADAIPDQNAIRYHARMVAGTFADGANDVSEQHDLYLTEAFEHR